MDDDERGALVAEIHSAAAFAEVQVRAFAVEPTAFHVIVDLPVGLELSRKEMLRRFRAVSAPTVLVKELPLLEAGDPAAWARLRVRFGELASFMRRIKQVSARSYHRKRGTGGRTWAARYMRTFVQHGNASRVLAAWIDHAGVRAGTVAEPGDDPFCTFGAAVGGDPGARAMITALFGAEDGSTGASWRTVADRYRRFIAGDPPPARLARGRAGREMLDRPALLRCEVPHFRAGIALGDRPFVEAVFRRNRASFGPARASGPRRIGGQDDGDLFTLRDKGDLRKGRARAGC
jgi:hypothetical protein